MAMGNFVFIAAGPNPRMRFKLVQCPVRCDREIMVFFKNIALCPLHGIVLTMESWNEEGDTHDN